MLEEWENDRAKNNLVIDDTHRDAHEKAKRAHNQQHLINQIKDNEEQRRLEYER